MNCSICICTYNGNLYLHEQIMSILSQISHDDEVIVIDDCSSDNTVDLILNYQDNRINVIVNEFNLGPVKSFEKAITQAKNGLIFLSDQDDIWKEGRYQIMKSTLLESDAFLLSSNSIFIGKNNESINFKIDGVFANDSKNYIGNIIDIFIGKTNYYGCCMIFKNQLIDIILPIPSFVESHDLWMAFSANLLKRNLHLEKPTLIRTIHGGNLSLMRRNIYSKIRTRFLFLVYIFILFARILKYYNKQKLYLVPLS